MSYPFVPSPPSEHWPRTAPIRAIVIHMAEGGGTVRWLQRPDGNSSHYVVEYTGRIVQMVREDRAAGSIDPTKVRRDNDRPFTYLAETITYGVTANRAALGGHWDNPNAAVIAIEVEGFAREGPNPAQARALRSLVADIRTRHNVPTLGHRDFQNYKACPGRLIPWAAWGGHGQIEVPEEPVERTFTFGSDAVAGTFRSDGEPDHLYLRLRDNTLHPYVEPMEKHAFGPVELTDGGIGGPNDPRKRGYVIGAEAAFVLAEDGTFAPLQDTVAAARERDRAAHLANLEEVYAA